MIYDYICELFHTLKTQKSATTKHFICIKTLMDPGEGMATHPHILAWEIPWTEEPGRIQSMGSQRVGHDWATFINIVERGNEGIQLKSLLTESCSQRPTLGVFWELSEPRNPGWFGPPLVTPSWGTPFPWAVWLWVTSNSGNSNWSIRLCEKDLRVCYLMQALSWLANALNSSKLVFVTDIIFQDFFLSATALFLPFVMWLLLRK